MMINLNDYTNTTNLFTTASAANDIVDSQIPRHLIHELKQAATVLDTPTTQRVDFGVTSL